MRGYVIWGGWAMLIVVSNGCGFGGVASGRVAVSGVVTLDGTPVTAGRINFIPDGNNDSPAAGGTIDASGRYRLPVSDGPMPGTYVVRIVLGGMKRTTFIGENLKTFEKSATIAAGNATEMNFDLTSPLRKAPGR